MNKKMYKVITFLIFLAYLSFLLLFFIINSEGKEVSILTFGAISNDDIDDTKAIQEAIEEQSAEGGGIVYFPEGKYLIDAVSSIVTKDNITLKFEEGAILEALPNDREHYQVIRIHDVENVQIVGNVEIQGERELHTGTTGEWGMGISIRGSNNVLVENIRINKMWGDGIYIGSTETQNYSENIEIHNSTLEKNRRQGISVISAKNLEIKNAAISNTSGTSPQGGIDIEPNNSTEILEDIRILNLSTNNNEGSGLKIYLKKFNTNSKAISIYIDSLREVKDGFAVREIKSAKGEVKVGEQYYLTEKDIDLNPVVKEIIYDSTVVTGAVQINSLITVKAGNTQIGHARSTSDGNFKVEIPKQKKGIEISVTATDLKGNTSDVINKIVKDN